MKDSTDSRPGQLCLPSSGTRWSNIHPVCEVCLGLDIAAAQKLVAYQNKQAAKRRVLSVPDIHMPVPNLVSRRETYVVKIMLGPTESPIVASGRPPYDPTDLGAPG
jgi:hypothetical protein